jgi:uncharacterized protein
MSSTEATTTRSSPPRDQRRYGRAVERRDGKDFPFYNGIPFALAVWQWVVVIFGCAAGFAVLNFYPAANDVQSLVPRFLFTAIPLAVFIAFTRGQWSRITQRLRPRDFGLMVLFAIANFLVSSLVGFVVKVVFGANANPATDGIHGAGEMIAFYVGTAMQLFGEELFTILPFLAVMAFCINGGLSRKQAILIAWLVTAAWFAAAHLPTYQWNFAQAFLIIGVARLVLTLAYIRTKNILVATGAHILSDWVIFTVTLVATAGAAAR